MNQSTSSPNRFFVLTAAALLILIIYAMVIFSPLSTVGEIPSSTIEGANQYDLFGWNISCAGDVNGDGYDDIIVGAPGFDNERGQAYIFYGGPWFSGDLKSESANITINGSAQGDRFGWDVSGAGDVNKDGLADIIIGAPGNTSKTGAAFIYYGHKFELASLKDTSANLTVAGEYMDDMFGASVSGAGDVNNDGYDDVIVGAPGFDKKSGKAYIFLGNKTKSMKLAAISAEVVFWGENLGDCFGFSVSDAGNVNNDEYDDIIIGAPGADKTFIFFGGDPMNAWVQTSRSDFDSAELKVHINTTNTMDGEAQLETFHSIKAMMAYFDGSNPPDTPEIPRNRTWNQQIWSAETEVNSIGNDENYWFVVESGTVRKNEKILAVSDAGLDILVQTSDGFSWSPPMELTDVVRDNKYRGFDIAYESLSGDALLAYYNDTSPIKLIPKYRIWNGTAWSSEMDAQPTGAGDIHWVLLTSHPFTDEILMVTLDRGNRDIYAQVWNGSAWGNVQLIESQASRDDNLCFDAVYEQQSGYGMIVWGGDSGSNKNLNYRRWTGNWSEPAGILPAADNQVNVVKLAADPKTNYIILGHLDNGRRIDIQIWNGTNWSAVTEVAPGNAERSNEHCFDVAYEATGDREGIIAYGIGDHRPAYRLINGTSVGPESFVLDANPPDNGRNPNWILLENDPQTSEIMLTYLIDDGGGNGGAEDDLGCEVWNGTEWKLPQRVELNCTRDSGQHFDVAYTDTSGFLISAPFDASTNGTWGRIKWTADIPGQTILTLRTRTSSDGVMWGDWSDWYGNLDRITSPANRWIQYEAFFETANITRTPILYDVSIGLNRANLTINGTPGEGFGWSVSSSGDLAGDGYDDVVVGAPLNDSANGTAYIFSGGWVKSEGDGDRFINLTNGEAANVTLIGNTGGGMFGYSVSCAGNASSDNYPDVVIGAPCAQKSGAIYLFFGSPTMNPVLMASDADAEITGDGELECFGWSVAWAGNISSAGYDDIAVGAPYFDDMGKSDAGRVYIFNLHYRPDMLINGGGDDEYQDLPFGFQVNVSWVTPGDNITYYMELQNDGTLPDTYNLNITTDMLDGWVWKITDNITAEEVFDGSSISLSPGENSTYTLNITVPISAVHGEESSVTVSAVSQNETAKKDTVRAVVRALDVTPPEIQDTTSGTPSTGDIFTISATVTDDVIVDDVNLYYLFDLFGGGVDGPHIVAMDPGYTKDLTAPSNTVALHYNISANDTSSNWNETGIISIGVLDNDLPVVMDTTSGAPTTGDIFAITASAADNIDVDKVHLYYWFDLYGGGTDGPHKVTMDAGYSKDVTVPSNAIALHYNISANDTSDNWNETGISSLDVVDNDLPIITDTTVGSPTTNDSFVVSAYVTDNIGIGEVHIYYWFDVSTGPTIAQNITMNNLGGGNYDLPIAIPADASTLYYNISANDINNNRSQTGLIFLAVGDDDLPLISDNTLGVPTTGDSFIVAAFTEDNIGLGEVHIYYWFDTTTGPTPPLNVTMNDLGGGNYESTIVMSVNALILFYNISANDTSNNWNETGANPLAVGDNDIPIITDTTNGSPTTGDSFNITAQAWDNIGMDEVHIYYWFETTLGPSIPVNATLNDHGGGNYNITLAVPSNALNLYYNISANDTSDKWNETGPIPIPVSDDDKPWITDTTAGTPTTGDVFSISALASDNIALGEVLLNYWFDLYGGGNEGPYTVSMDPSFFRDIMVPTDAVTLHYYLPVSDTSNNWNQTGQTTLEVQDNDPPSVRDTSTGTPTTGDVFTIRANVTDNIDVDGVRLYYWFETLYGATAPMNVSMNDQGLGNFDCTITAPTSALELHYNISANDTTNNWNETGPLMLNILDNDAPLINAAAANPPIQESGGPVNITANVSDELGVLETWVNITCPDGSWANVSMEWFAGSEWHHNTTYTEPGTYNFTVWVKDSSGNWNSSEENTFTINPSSPTVDFIQIRTEPYDGGDVVEDMNYIIDDIDEFYASGYNYSHGYLGDFEVDWICNNEDSASLNPTFGNCTTFTALDQGTGRVFAVSGSLQNSTAFEVFPPPPPEAPEIVGTIPNLELNEDFELYYLDLYMYASDYQDPPANLHWYLTGVNESVIWVLGENQSGLHVLTLISMIDEYGDMEVTYWLVDSHGNTASQTAWINVTPLNDPPSISGCPDLFVHFDHPYSFDFAPYISDNDNPLSELTLSCDDTSHSTTFGLSATFEYPESMLDDKVFVVLRVSDGLDSDSDLITITVTSDYPPVTVDKIPDVVLFENETRKAVFDLDDYIMDPDGDSLYMSYGHTHVNIIIYDDHTVDFSASGEWNGMERVTFRAEDPIGAMVEQTINVTVIPINDPPEM
ncbi:MAG: FG-GAP repeat protein, partial [Thermoplasmata archaeon]